MGDDPPGAQRQLGAVDHSSPHRVFPFIGSPAHGFRLWRGAFAGGPPLTAELPVQYRGPALEAIEAPPTLAGVAEAVACTAPEMLSAVWQKRALWLGGRFAELSCQTFHRGIGKGRRAAPAPRRGLPYRAGHAPKPPQPLPCTPAPTL